MQYKTLGKTGAAVSVIGFGASPLGGVFGVVDPEEGRQAVDFAVDQGVNFFDVSPYYGRTLAEERLGQFLAGKRHKIFLATKCGRYDAGSFDFSAKRTITSIDESLMRLQTDYVDLLQAHDIEFADVRQVVEETIPTLLDIQRQGKARFIGITSYQLRLMARIAAETSIDTVLSYCRYNLLVDDMDTFLTPIVKQRRRGLINASPLHMGILAGTPVPAWHPAPGKVKDAGVRVAQLCREHGFNPCQVALRFCLDHSYAASTLIGMSTRRQVEGNLGALTLQVGPALLEEIRRTVGPVKNAVWQSGRPENADYR